MMQRMRGFGHYAADDSFVDSVTTDQDAQIRAAIAAQQAASTTVWRDIIVTVVSSVVSGIALYYLLDSLRKKRR